MSWVPPEGPSDHNLHVLAQGDVNDRRSPLWVRVVGSLVVIGIVAGLVSSLLLAEDSPPKKTGAQLLKALVDELSGFVETERSLKFVRPVKVELLDEEAFIKRLLEDAEEDRADTEKMEELLGVLGLIESNGKLFDDLNKFLAEAVLGFYDPETDELVVRGLEATPFVRLTLVHELTHALDDQVYNIDRQDLLDADDERGLGFSALVEGSALSVESAYRKSLSSAERSRATREEQRFGSDIELDISWVISDLIGFPYVVGEELVDTIVRHFGNKKLAAAFENPPSTSEQLLNPQLYIEGEGAIAVEPPPSDGTQIDQGSFGQYFLGLIFTDVLDSQEEIDAATNGWGGDWYVAWRQGSQTCIRASFKGDTERDLDELGDAFDKWAKSNNDIEVDRASDLVTITACKEGLGPFSQGSVRS